MSKSKLILTEKDTSGDTAPAVVGCKPVGSQVVVERLSPKDILGTSLQIGDGAEVGSPQAYILALGPMVDDKWGFKVGDRVLLQGVHTPMPVVGRGGRQVSVVEPHAIKAILLEE